MTLATDRVGRLDDADHSMEPVHRGVARDQLEALTDVVEDLAGRFELRPLLERILRHAAGLLGCSSGSICTVNERAGTYRKEIDLGVACRSGREFPLTEGVTGEILRAGGPVTFDEYTQVRGGHIDPVDRAGLHATIGVPIRWAGTVIGACIVFSRDPARRFDSSDVTLLELFAGHAGLAMVNARLHAQAAELARAEATGLERERIVRDVHDSVARALASVVLHLGDRSEHPSGQQHSEPLQSGPMPPPSRDRLDLARRAAQSALTATRTFLPDGADGAAPSQQHRMTPAPSSRTTERTVLEGWPEPTIEEAIAPQVDWASSTGLDIRLVVAGKSRPLPAEVVNELFGVAQQAIANIVAHADARTARVGLVYGATDVVLLIQDDGVGFDDAQLPRPDGSGAGIARSLIPEHSNLVSRAEHLGGTMQIDATPGWGTTIRTTVPYVPVTAQSAPRSTVLVVEHRPLVRAGLLALLAEQADLVQVIGEIDSADDVIDAHRLLTPDVVLIDVALPGGAARVTALLRGNDPDTAVVAIGDSATAGDARLRDMVQAGARAAVMIDAEVSAFTRAIGAAARGDALFTDEILHGLYTGSPSAVGVAGSLTAREREVRELVSQGLPDKLIAERLHISVKTVEKHVGSALRKSGARNRTELAGMTGWGARNG